ncbi:unnamed protein product [Leptosia nina]|uniref:Nicotinamide riboside kinase 1 n=1 Tax=Leptosia nina TaxID=320188 RepID=A0AAV1JH43_9NEOP
MDLPDALIGKITLITTFTVFTVFVIWVNSYTFFDDELYIYKYIPDPQWALLFCALWGLFFIGDDSPKHVKCQNLEHNNYDILSSLDMNQMYEDVVKTIKGEVFAHEHCTDYGNGKWEAQGKKFLILEGFTVLNFKPLLELCNLRYYFVLEYGECLSRRVHRLYDPPDIPGYFEECVWPEHLKYRSEMEKDKRVQLLDGTSPDTLEMVLKDIAALGGRQIT